MTLNLFFQVKNKKEDSRINKGLQLLQNKISILEDLSDKTDNQIRKSIHNLDTKANEVKNLISEAQNQNYQLSEAMQKCFSILSEMNRLQPTEAQIKDYKTTQYVKAAQMANQGYSLETIAEQIDLSPAELNMIIKVNKNELQFANDQLPEWLKTQTLLNQNFLKDEELKSFENLIQKQNQLNIQPSVPNQNSEMQSASMTKIFQNQIHQKNFQPEEIKSNEKSKIIKPFEFKKI